MIESGCVFYMRDVNCLACWLLRQDYELNARNYHKLGHKKSGKNAEDKNEPNSKLWLSLRMWGLKPIIFGKQFSLRKSSKGSTHN